MTKQEQITRLSKEKGYSVDKDGNVFNKDGKKIALSVNTKGSGYKSFNIRVNGSNPTRSFVHRLQAFQKFGDVIFEENLVIRHLNGDSSDNTIDNIGIGTTSDNMLDIPKEKRILNASNPTYNHEDVIRDKKNGLTYKEIMEKHGIKSKGTVSFILNKSLKRNTAR
jgi:hypothetical protein